FDGVFYAKAEELDISPWVSDLIKTKRPLAQSRANFEVWTNFSQSEVTSVQAELSESLLEWGSGRAKTITGISGGSLQALPNDENRQGGWNVRVDQLVLNSSNETLTTDLIGSISANGDALINTVKPVQINPFLLLLPLFMDDTSEEEIRGLNPKGELATLQVQWHNGQPSLAAKVLDLQWDKTDKVPGLSSLDADFFWYKNNGAIYLESADSLLSANGVIKKDVNIKLFKSQFYIYPEQIDSEDKQWVVKGSDMLFDSDAVTLHPQFKLNTSTGFMSLYVDVSPLALNEVSSLFPPSLMGANTDKYLTRAFTGKGEIANARVLWHGRTSDFPFDDNTGIFQAYVDIEQGDFLFAPDWPALNNLDLSLYFVNNALVMESPSATLAGMKISDMSAAIPSFSPDARLIIYANGTGTGNALTALMMDSSLKKSLGKVLNEDVQIGGPLTADIKLDIPFKGKDVVASGTAHLSNNPVFVATTNMLFDKASGEVSFVNGDIDASGLQAQFLKQPVNLSLSGRQSDTYDLNVELGGRWHVHPLANYVNTDLTEYIDGESDWNTTVQLSLSNSGFNYTANLTADLTATQSVLPAPFDTPAGSSLPLLITSKGDSKASNVEASLGDNIRFDGVLPHKEMQFSRAHLALGESDIANIGTGFSISANLPQADVQEWFTTINMLLSGKGKDTSTAVAKTNAQSSIQSNESKKANLFGTPSRIFAKADKLNFAGHSIKDAQLSATERNKDWILDLASPQARATIRINSDLDEQGIEINADYLSLEKPVEAVGTTKADSESGVELATNSAMPNEEGESPYNIDPNTLPPIYFYCQSCGVHGIDLGEITLDIAKEENGLAIRQLLVKSDETNVTATGYWKHMGGEIQSALNGTLTSPDVGQMLK
ncbi:MAG: DUF3971 domain-containing protein, partial [Pseudomonadota bacterium]|nr:DUF3971 domain-containing protein [Pseudomonadota bacterium]